MNLDRQRSVDRIFQDALERPAQERLRFLELACGGDPSLKQEVETLIRSFEAAGSFLESAPASSLIGHTFGPYQVKSLLGVGGMGHVYLASDSKLKRDVAIKVLPNEFSRDLERVARFQREAEVLASLNHPHIAGIHDFVEFGELRFLVLELVEGETLADRLARGRIPMGEALTAAKQIAEALEAAHEKGIIHRDLKPANIKITPKRGAKVLDFGLAKVRETGAYGASHSSSPTLLSGSMPGAVMGTTAYMSPEQATGKPVDGTSDVWAFGCVLYEMLTGRAVFERETTAEIVAGVLNDEPDWHRLPAETPEGIRRLLRRCLQKERNRRLHDIADARLEIEDCLSDSLTYGHASPILAQDTKRPRRKAGLAWIAAFAVAVALIVALAIPTARYLRALLELPETRVEINTPGTTDPISFALSPDGRQIVFVASGDGGSRLWFRSLASTTVQPLAGTEGAAYPFWSPDSRSIGFFAAGRLKRLDIGGAPQILTNAVPLGGSWNANGIILFTRTLAGPLFRIPAAGGEAVAVTKAEKAGDRFPFFLPDGRQFLFFDLTAPAGIYLGSLDSTEIQRLTTSDTAGVYLSSGWLLWVRAGTLVAQRLDIRQEAFTGDPVTLADSVAFDTNVKASAVSVSAEGLVAYRAGGGRRRQLGWFDRSGKPLGTMGAPDENNLQQPSVSPDGERVAVWRAVEGNVDIWLLDRIRTNRFTFEASSERNPIWSSDGRWIVFDSTRTKHRALYQKSSGGGAAEELLMGKSAQDTVANDWSVDGRFILYMTITSQTDRDLWALPMEGERKPSVFLKTNYDERSGQFSPDRRWVAYESNESGSYEIYIRPFPSPTTNVGAANPGAAQWRVSTAGGIYPRWRRDGKELYYIGPNGEMMAAPITATATTLHPGAPVALFPTRIFGGGVETSQGRQYDVAKDGRFLINMILDDSSSSPITLVQNWKPPAK